MELVFVWQVLRRYLAPLSTFFLPITRSQIRRFSPPSLPPAVLTFRAVAIDRADMAIVRKLIACRMGRPFAAGRFDSPAGGVVLRCVSLPDIGAL